MAEIILGIAASHTTLMNTHWDRVDRLPRAHDFRNALAAAAAALRETRPDVVVIIGSNHFRGFWLDLMPAFTIGVDEVISAGEHGTPKGVLPSHPALAQHLCDELIARDIDIAFSTRLMVDHGISHAFQWLVQSAQVPIVPIIINCFAPPLPTLRRTRLLGTAIGSILRAFRGSERIAIIATGGLSHALPFPDWRDPQGEEDAFLVRSWREGRGRFQEFEVRRREIIVNFPARINETFDRQLLAHLTEGRLWEWLEAHGEVELIRLAGNGANEIRTWLALSAALNDSAGRILAYSNMPEWLTGMAVALIEPNFNTTLSEETSL